MNKRFWLHGTLVAAAVTVASQLAQVSPAQAGGGGCHGLATNGSGATVEMKNACFAPTVVRVRPGDSVTFVNRDPMQHSVTGTAELFGSYDALVPGQSVTYRFATNGVYAYSCIFHPGMTGAVVVGDGSGPGLATGAQPVVVAPAKAPAAAARSVAPAAPQSPWAWLVAAALVAGGGLGFVLHVTIVRRSLKDRGGSI